MTIERSELSPEVTSLTSINPFFMNASSPRIQMFCSHIGQSLVANGATVRRIQTGVEREYAKYTFSIKMPHDGTVIKVFQKYPRTVGMGSIRENPTIVIMYERHNRNREIDIIEIPKFHCIHQHYGFKYVFKPIMGMLTPGTTIPAGTILADSPLVTDNGDYMYGLETNVAMMSINHIVEDAVVISKSYAKRLTTTGFGSRTISWGKNRYPVNIYGTPENPKSFPEIGDRVRSDGLLFALREYDELLSVVDLTPEALCTPDYNFDKLVYAEPNAKIVDIIIHKGNQPRDSVPIGLTEQCDRYFEKTCLFFQEIVKEYNGLKKVRGDKLALSPRAHRMVVESMAMIYDDPKNRVTKTFNRNPLDEWRVTVVFEYDVVPDVAAKLSGTIGDKGVIVAVWPDEDMPIDKWGNRAEIIVDADSTIKRMNIGRWYEQHMNAAGRYVQIHLPQILGNRSTTEIDAAWDYLWQFYEAVSPVMCQIMRDSDVFSRKLEHIEGVIKDGVYIYLPTDSPKSHLVACTKLTQMYPDLIGPITYKAPNGEFVQTIDNVMIGSMYILLLEKTGNVWTAVDSSKLQHFGIPAKLTNEDKFSAPGRENPVRVFGEAEVRSVASIAGGDIVADILDQSNNPTHHRAVIDCILHADKPTNIDRVIDRSIYPIGNGRMQSYVHHFLECAGARFVRKRS